MNNLMTTNNLSKPLGRNLMNLDIFDMFDSVFKNRYALQNMDTLPIEVTQNDKVYNVSVEAPGATKDNISVYVDQGNLKISVEATNVNEQKEGEEVIVSERQYSKKTRMVYLGKNIDENNIKASYQDGVLKLEIPKLEQEQVNKKIEIQ